jgi:uncharacterized Zn ribbon protein
MATKTIDKNQVKEFENKVFGQEDGDEVTLTESIVCNGTILLKKGQKVKIIPKN